MNTSRTTMLVSSILMTISLLAVLPFSLRLAGTWNERFFEIADGYRVSNYLLPMGFASLTLICVGLIVTWSGLNERSRSAWLTLFLIAWLFYFPVLVLPQFPTNWAARFESAVTSSMARELTLHFLGFWLMLVALLLSVRGVFWKSKIGPAKPD